MYNNSTEDEHEKRTNGWTEMCNTAQWKYTILPERSLKFSNIIYVFKNMPTNTLFVISKLQSAVQKCKFGTIQINAKLVQVECVG